MPGIYFISVIHHMYNQVSVKNSAVGCLEAVCSGFNSPHSRANRSLETRWIVTAKLCEDDGEFILP